MRAVFSCGLDITLTLADKEKAQLTGILECNLPEWKKPKVVLHIVDQPPKSTIFEEPGFHIESTPRSVGPKFRTQYDIYLSKERFHDLTNPTEDSIIDGGHFLSRSLYDRIEFHYYAIRPNPKMMKGLPHESRL